MPTKKIEEAEEVTRCPECNSGHLSFDYERGELICEECGLVLTDQMIDQGPEWRGVDVEQGEKSARTGGPMTLTIHPQKPPTTIRRDEKEYYRKTVPHPDPDPRAKAQVDADETAGLRVPVLFRTQADRRGPVASGRDPERSPGQGIDLGPRAHGRRRGGDLHRLNPVQRAPHATGGRRRRGRDRSDDPKPLQGIDGKARHQSRTVVRAAATARCDAVSIGLRNRRGRRRRRSTSPRFP